MTRVLVTHECSGAVRSALLRRGIDAYSCDLKGAEDGERDRHFVCDAFEAIHSIRPDVLISFPDCTYLTTSAAWAYFDPDFEKHPRHGCHQKPKPETLVGADRRAARRGAIHHVRMLRSYGIPTCIENPARSFLSKEIGPPTQVIHPHQFGHDASKATGLWLQELPPLHATQYVAPRDVNGLPRWANQTDSGQNRLPPGANRAADRARTYQGIADAMAEQWFE